MISGAQVERKRCEQFNENARVFSVRLVLLVVYQLRLYPFVFVKGVCKIKRYLSIERECTYLMKEALLNHHL